MLLLAALAYAQNPLKRPDPYAGGVEGNNVVLDLAAVNGQYGGTLAVEGQKLAVGVKVSEGGHRHVPLGRPRLFVHPSSGLQMV